MINRNVYGRGAGRSATCSNPIDMRDREYRRQAVAVLTTPAGGHVQGGTNQATSKTPPNPPKDPLASP